MRACVYNAVLLWHKVGRKLLAATAVLKHLHRLWERGCFAHGYGLEEANTNRLFTLLCCVGETERPFPPPNITTHTPERVLDC